MPKKDADGQRWQYIFLEKLRTSGNVSFAARSAGKARSVVYVLRRNDTEFAQAWEDALEEAADLLELEALRRAVDGTVEDKFFQGNVIGSIRRYSDSLLMFLLKARRPAQFDPHVRNRIVADGDDEDRIRAEIERKIARLSAGARGE